MIRKYSLKSVLFPGIGAMFLALTFYGIGRVLCLKLRKQAFLGQTKNLTALLSDYGYNEDYVSSLLFQMERPDIFLAAGSILLCGVLLLALFFYVLRRREAQMEEMTEYIRKLNTYYTRKSSRNLNKNEFSNLLLPVSENTEDSYSLLRNEIYKTTVMLQETAELRAAESRRLSDALADISHQIKTPLTSALVLLDSIRENTDMPEDVRQDFLASMDEQLEWISSLVVTLLKIAKFDAGTTALRWERVDLGNFLQEIAGKLSVLFELCGVSIVWEGDKNVYIYGDKFFLLEAFSNLLKNCAEHSPKGGRIFIRILDNSVYTRVSIRDEGEGIDEKTRLRIFDRFYQAENGAKGGFGLGLPLAKSIIEAQGGYLTAESGEDGGMMFVVKILHSVESEGSAGKMRRDAN